MESAIDEMKKCGRAPKVGAVIVLNGEIVATGFRQNGVHAERCAIEAAHGRGLDLSNAILYTTLEPCVDVSANQKRPCCADLIVAAGIREVVIGRYDPNPMIYRQGWKRLGASGVHRRDFPIELRNVIDSINKEFEQYFSSGIGPAGGAKLDHKDGASFRIKFSSDDNRFMDIAWTLCGVDAAYGYALNPVKVALARFATDFDEIDDPTAYDFGHSVRIGVGEIGIFWGPEACILVRPKEVQSGPGYGSENYFVNFEYCVRLFQSR